MRPEPIPPKPGQESVWDYPRPPRLEDAGVHAQMARAARDEAERWTWRASTETVLGYYEEVIRSATR